MKKMNKFFIVIRLAGFIVRKISRKIYNPLHSVIHQKLFLNVPTAGLSETLPEKEDFIRYEAIAKRGINKATFIYQFREDTELTRGMNLRLWVAAELTDDMDLFVVVKKLDGQVNEIYFSGYNGSAHDVVAKGWLFR